MEGEIISRDNIKPSSPTPHDKKTYKLSLLDQINPPIFFPIVLYFPNSDNSPANTMINTQESIHQTTQILKESLSATLSRFFPLAGRLSEDSLSIDCNDEGVLFIVAKFSNNNLSDFLKKPDTKACRDHIPSEFSWEVRGPGSHVAMIQVNYFRCGSVALGSIFLHRVIDGASFSNFVKAWAAEARLAEKLSPDYAAQTFFPQNGLLPMESHVLSPTGQYFKTGKTVTRRYVFDESAILRLRAGFEGLELDRRPTRVELVTALIWKCFMVASASSNPSSMSVVSHSVNMRGKAEPPFPQSSFGNFIWVVPASSNNSSEADRELKHLFGKVRNAIRKVDADFVRGMQGSEGFSCFHENLQQSWNEYPGNGDYLLITSWCGFGLYDIDFGFGKPIWIPKGGGGGDTESLMLNALWLMDTRDGRGIEAWLALDDKYFVALNEMEELRDLASVDPSPLDCIAATVK